MAPDRRIEKVFSLFRLHADLSPASFGDVQRAVASGSGRLELRVGSQAFLSNAIHPHAETVWRGERDGRVAFCEDEGCARTYTILLSHCLKCSVSKCCTKCSRFCDTSDKRQTKCQRRRKNVLP